MDPEFKKGEGEIKRVEREKESGRVSQGKKKGKESRGGSGKREREGEVKRCNYYNPGNMQVHIYLVFREINHA